MENEGKLVTHYLGTVDFTAFEDEPIEFKVTVNNLNTYIAKKGYFFEGLVLILAHGTEPVP